MRSTLEKADCKPGKYLIRLETLDGTLEKPAAAFGNKANALSYARSWAKTISCEDVARVHVDCNDLAVASFTTRFA